MANIVCKKFSHLRPGLQLQLHFLVQITGQLAEVATSNLGHLEFTMFLEGQLREDAG
jgi:hypothetical protein